MEGAMLPTDAAGWKPVFDFLEQETKFQAAAAAITATAAAWWVKALIAQDAKEPAHPRASRLAALLLLIVAFTFYINEGRLAAKYGTLARAITFAQPILVAYMLLFPTGIRRLKLSNDQAVCK